MDTSPNKRSLDMCTPPNEVNGTPVTALTDKQTFQGEEWITLVPDREEDARLWEFSITTGRIIQTRFEWDS